MHFDGFPKKSLDFLKTLRKNNTKEWFETHRSEYDELILEPSRAFVTEMGEHLQALVPTINAVAKINGSLFRIYRDIRFSKDKTPIKSRIGIIFWQGTGRRMQSSSFYLHFSPDELFFATGIRGFSQEMLKSYRKYIAVEKNRKALYEIMDKLKRKGYLLPDPRYKRYPKGFDKESRYAELSLMGSVYAYKVFEPQEYLFSQKLVNKAYELYEEMYDLHQWVYEMTLNADKSGSGRSMSL
jgi:uncharacterized protein (TIGR02453 family)